MSTFAIANVAVAPTTFFATKWQRKNITMAEQKNSQSVSTPSIPSTNGAVSQTQKCEFADCIKCVESVTSSKGNTQDGDKVQYKFTMHYRSQEEIEKHIREESNRVVAKLAREGKPIKTANVYADGSPALTFDERVESYSTNMSKAQLAKLVEMAQKALEALKE